MKKYFLDERYRKFTRRVCTVLSILAGIIVFVVCVAEWYYEYDNYYFFVSLFLSALSAIGVWILYWVIRWILETLPDE